MKATIEKREKTMAFKMAMCIINNAKNEAQLRDDMKSIFDNITNWYEKYQYGFGGSHMWIHNEKNERVIIVTF